MAQPFVLAPDGSTVDVLPASSAEHEHVLVKLGRGSHGVPKGELHVSRVAAEIIQTTGSTSLRIRVRNRNPLFLSPPTAVNQTAGEAAAALPPHPIASGSTHDWPPGHTLFLLHSAEQPRHYPFVLVARDASAATDSQLALSMPDPDATQDIEPPPVVLVVTSPTPAAAASRAPSATSAVAAALAAAAPAAAAVAAAIVTAESAEPVIPSLSFAIVPSLALDPEDDLPAHATAAEPRATVAASSAEPADVAAAPVPASNPDAAAVKSSRKRSHSPGSSAAAAASSPAIGAAATSPVAAASDGETHAGPAFSASSSAAGPATVPAAVAAAHPDANHALAGAADLDMPAAADAASDAAAADIPAAVAAADESGGPPAKRARLLTIKRSLDSLGASAAPAPPPPPFLSGWAVHIVSEGIGARQMEILHSSVIKRGGVLLSELPRHSFHTTAAAERDARRRGRAAATAVAGPSTVAAAAEPAKHHIMVLVSPSIHTRKELCEVIARKQRHEAARLEASRAHTHHLAVPKAGASASSPPSSPGRSGASATGAASPNLLSLSGSSAASTASASAAGAASSVRLRSQWRIVHVEYLVQCNKRNALLPTDAFLLDDEEPAKAQAASRKLEFSSGTSAASARAGAGASASAAAPAAASAADAASAVAAAAASGARPDGDDGTSLHSHSDDDETDSKYADDDFPSDAAAGSSASGGVIAGPGGLASPAAIAAWNNAIAAQLSETAENYNAQSGEHFRSNAFRRAAGIVRSLPYALRDVSSIADQRGMGPSTLKEIRTILSTGHSARLDALRADPVLACHQLLQTVHGIGPKTAAKLYALGVRTLDDLRKYPKLTAAQATYLRYYDELREKIPRGEVAQFESAIRSVLREIDPQLTMTVCGSYRRGKDLVGDIDCLITHPDPDYHYEGPGAAKTAAARRAPGSKAGAASAAAAAAPASPSRRSSSTAASGGQSSFARLLDDLVRRLHAAGILTDDLVTPSSLSGSSGGSRPGSGSGSGSGRRASKSRSIYESGLENEMYGGVGILPRDEARGWGGLHRRIDLKVYSQTEFPFALLYFTGSKDFNRHMRLYANSRFSYHLSDKSLSPYLRRGNDKIVSGVGIACANEEEIFAALELDYVPPTQRDTIPAVFLKK